MTLYLKPTGAGHASSKPFALSSDTVELSVGRHESNDLRVPQEAVSARHARLGIRSESSIEVIDCESSHGTFVNDERISTRLVSPGDRIRFATAEFELIGGPNGDVPVSDEGAEETQAISPVPDLNELEQTVGELRSNLAKRDEEIELLRDSLAKAEAARDEAREAAEKVSVAGGKCEVEAEIEAKKLELESVSSDLEKLRREVEEEVRKAQRLSRRSTIPGETGRVSPATPSLDAEQEIYRLLIGRIELFDQMIDGYRRSRKFNEIADELFEFREKLASILSDNGVEPFELELGTALNPKHRREVQILERKGWGTRKFIERQFRPGIVTQIVKPGYRIGSGDQTAILRKVEVLIKEAEV